MAICVIGPTSVGKSMFIERGTNFDRFYSNILFGYEISNKNITHNSLIHYNLLLQYGSYVKNNRDIETVNETWDFFNDPNFSLMLDSKLIERFIVLVAPIEELRERIQTRTVTPERQVMAGYNSNLWLNAIDTVNIAARYEELFDILDDRSIPYDVYFSSKAIEGYSKSDRVYIHANLKGVFIPLPGKSQIQETINRNNFVYQSVRVPHGLTTTSGFPHLPADRDAILKALLPPDLLNSSVLDIGCALGGLLLLAERMGAEEVTGIELDKSRYDAAVSLSKLLYSRVKLYQIDFLEFDPAQQFDHVFILNVVHHVPDFLGFLRKAAKATMKTLTIEFPNLTDAKFLNAHNISRERVAELDDLPLVGVSSMQRADQTYVYSTKAVEQLVMSEIGGFQSYAIKQSAISDRAVMVFHR